VDLALADFLTALGLVLVLEGLLYAAFPEPMKRAVAAILQMPAGSIRTIGLVAAVIGLAVIWLVRG
jgi:hypothetical protein